ncbi:MULTISPECIES: hypothetical protein [Thermomonas]|jgi:hypothetical protein|uniref:hypothetical protein n=1 Tax=Thermomonas TaxID=141948 RepID=UPI0012EC2856|nr:MULTISPECIES: hypothetical protein [Thermomonas]
MKLKISSYADAGNFQKERIVFKAISELELGEYAVFCSALSSDGNATSGKKTAYWFPDGVIKKDDLVVLYTKKGTSSTKELDGGRTAHFFYWGDDRAMWGSSSNAAVLLQVASWTKKAPPSS